MGVEMVKAIGELWLLALVLLACVVVIVFKEQLRALMNELMDIKIKRGDVELAMNRQGKEIPENQKAVESEPTSQASGIETAEESPMVGCKANSPRDTYFKAANAKDRRGLLAAFEEVQREETDEKEKLHNEAMNYHVLYANFGDESALGKLRSLANRDEAGAVILRWLGISYEKAADHGRAAESFEEAAKRSESAEQRAQELARAAINLFRCGEKEAAFAKLISEFSKGYSREAESHLYEGLAALYQKAGEPVLRALALEKALEGRPNNRSLRFQAAYAYSHESFSRISLLHYRKQLEFYPDDLSSLNNLGVEYGRLNLPSKSIRLYKEASERGETLAMSNLANVYMDAGFADEAAQILVRARTMKYVHPNVGTSLAALSSMQEAEDEKEEQCLSAAREQQSFFIAFAEAAFTSPKKSRGGANFVGRWKMPDGTEFEIAQEGTRISGDWQINDSKHYISGNVTNKAFTGVIGYKGQFSFDSKERRILGYLGDGPGSLHVFTAGTNSDDHKIMVCCIGDGMPSLEGPNIDTRSLPDSHS